VAQEVRERPLEKALDGIPGHLAREKVMKPLRRLCQAMDEVGRLDEEGNVFVEEDALRRSLKRFLPHSAADGFVSSLKELPDHRLVRERDQEKRLRPIVWLALAERVEGFEARSSWTFRELRLTASSQDEDVVEAGRRAFPEIPATFFNPKTLTPRLEELVREEESRHAEGLELAELETESLPGGIFDCLVRHLGWWAALTLVLVAAAAIIALSLAMGPTGAILIAKFWYLFSILAGVFVGSWTVVVVGTCVLNPWWP
jgi:hypothetical protein